MVRWRGEHHARGIWQPRRSAGQTPVPNASVPEARPQPTPAAPAPEDVTELARRAAVDAVAQVAGVAAADMAFAREARRRRARARTTALTLAVAIAFTVISIGQGSPAAGSRKAALPTTPRQWVDAYLAAAIDDPSRVCSQLFSPALAAIYAAAAHGSCTRYFARESSTSTEVRRILKDGNTAVAELHQTIEKNSWDVVLNRRGSGWRAVDLVAGRALR